MNTIEFILLLVVTAYAGYVISYGIIAFIVTSAYRKETKDKNEE